jgi:hypothetical protein
VSTWRSDSMGGLRGDSAGGLRRLVIAAVIGVIAGLIPYVWARYQAATIIVPISGQVMLDGHPLANAYVKFLPVPRAGQNPRDTNPGSHGYTDRDGNFTLLQIANDEPGVIVGEHKIMLRTGQPGPGPDGIVGEQVPFTWQKGMRSYNVSWTGSRQAVFHIETIDKYSPRSVPR